MFTDVENLGGTVSHWHRTRRQNLLPVTPLATLVATLLWLVQYEGGREFLEGDFVT